MNILLAVYLAGFAAAVALFIAHLIASRPPAWFEALLMGSVLCGLWPIWILVQFRSRRVTVVEGIILDRMRQEPNRHWFGLDLMREIGEKSGVAYPALRSLEDKMLLESWWADPMTDKPKRRMYKLRSAPKPRWACYAGRTKKCPGAARTALGVVRNLVRRLEHESV